MAMKTAAAYTIYYLVALALIITGIVLMGYSIAMGQGSVSLVVIIPIFIGTGLFAGLGVLCIFAGIFVLFVGTARRWAQTPIDQYELHNGFAYRPPPSSERPSRPEGSYPSGNEVQKKSKAGGVVLIGPIPIIFGSDASITKTVLILAIVLTVIAVIVFFVVWSRVLF